MWWRKKRSAALERFLSSMNIGYIQWHDGLGYDLEALDLLDDNDRAEAEKALVARAEKDWRDLEALNRLATPAAIAAILHARSAKNPEIRLHALGYGPEATDQQWEAAISYALDRNLSYSDGLTFAFRAAVAHPTPGVLEALWRYVRAGGREGTFDAGETIVQIAGLALDEDLRQLCLRLQGPDSPQKRAAIAELERIAPRSP